jgi:hypothetical protein
MSSPLPPVVADLADEPVVADLIPEAIPVAPASGRNAASGDAVAMEAGKGEDVPAVVPLEAVEDEEAVPVVMPLDFIDYLGLAIQWVFGVGALFLGLSVLASVPVGQLLVLGYLLEASGRVAKSGRLRDGFIGVRIAAKFGGIAFVGFLMWLPLYFISLQAEAAQIIDPNGRIARQWQLALTVLATVFALHAVASLLRGGRIRHFLNPFNIPWLAVRAFRGKLYTEARDRVWDTAKGMRIPYYFWLGVRGFAGAFLWLAIPLMLLGLGHRFPLVGFIGGTILAVVVLYVPFLQVRFAKKNSFRAFGEVLALRQVYRRAPLAFAFALWIHLLFAIPLYILKIEVIPRDLVFLEGLMFLLFIFPARLLGGWAYARGARREEPRFVLSRWFGRFAVMPVVFAYVFVVFLSQHIGWQGIGSLYEQHAFLLPVPFVTWK